MSKNASVIRKRRWSDDYIQYGFQIFRDKDAQELKGPCVICISFKFVVIASRLIMINFF